jgi:4'-phosphopantetheinyl transferase
MLDTYILKIDRNIAKNDFDRLLCCISEEKKERISQFHRFEDAQRSLLGNILARYAICRRLGIKNKDLAFSTNDYGKPILISPRGIHFSISHSGNWVVCAVAKSSVGIDVEVIEPIDFKIAERFFSIDEYHSLLNQPNEMQLKYFYMLWTLKESYIKAEGKGLSIPLNSFSIRINNEISVINCNGRMEYYFYKSILEHNAIYAVCHLSNYVCTKMYSGITQFMKEMKYIYL